MSAKRIRKKSIILEALEARRLLSGALAPLPTPAAGAGNAVQAGTLFYPTYQALDAQGSLSPLQTAGAQGYSPSALRTAYGLNQVTFGSATADGSGQTIAIVDAYDDPTITADLQAFDQAFGLADPTFTKVAQNGSTTLPGVDPAGAGTNNWEGEEALDVEWAHALAPGAAILLVEAADASPSNLFAAVNYARQVAGVSVISMSFGGNENTSETQYDSIFTTPTGHTGVTFVASTGDAGVPAGYPAYSPNVVAAGGTSLSLDSLGNYLSETGWSGSGGGISQVEAQGSYQNGSVTQSTTYRTAPDVAFNADPSTGVSVYDSYNNGTSTPWEILGGTSAAAPAWAGIFAIANQGRVLAGGSTLDSRSNTLPLLYSAPASDFHDIITGNNGDAAGAGYDLVTGRGSPVLNLLIPYLVTGTFTPPPPSTTPTIASLSANALTLTQGTPLVLTANSVSDPGGTGTTVTFYEETNGVSGLQTGTGGDLVLSTVTASPYTASIDTTSVVGTFTLYAQVTDASGAASAAGTTAPSVTVTITAPSTSGPNIASLSVTPNPVVSGNTVTLAANGITDAQTLIRRVYFYQETNGVPGLQTGPSGDFAFRAVNALTGSSIALTTAGVTGTVTFYALALDYLGNVSATGTTAPSVTLTISSGSVPAAPTGLTATAISASQIDLAFSETSSGQTGFNIERALDPNFTTYTTLFSINRPTAVTYSDTGLASNTPYYYRVQAFNAAGNSPFSNTASATTTGASPSVGLTTSAAPSIYGQAVTFTATVTAPSGTPATPSGTVQFQIDGSNFGNPVPLSNGTATSPATTTLNAAAHTISALYSGDATFGAATATGTQNVTPAPLTVTVDPQTITYGQPIPTLTGTLSGVLGNDGITGICNTTATLFSDPGTYPITVTLYDPNNKLSNYTPNYPGSTVTILKANQTITWATPAALDQGTALSTTQLNATVSGISGGSTPGALTYNPPAGTLLGAGSQTLSVSAAATPDYNATTASVTLTVTPYTTHQRYVAQLYQDLLGRLPDPGGLASWTALLDSGQYSYAQVATALTSSREYDADIVDGFYVTYLGRHAEPGGLNDWVNLMQGGYNAEQIRAGILGSPEYFAGAGGTNTSFVTALYQSFLQRTPDPGGLAAWINLLVTGQDTTAQVATGFLNSAENRTDLITGFYQTYLHRAPDPAGLAAWTTLLANGITQPQIISAFVSAPEYLTLNNLT